MALGKKRSSSQIDHHRRAFAQKAACIVAGCTMPYSLLASELCQQNALEELEKCRRANFNMMFASPYDTHKWRSSPHMHQQLKNNVEHFSDGKIYFNTFDNGILGVGTELAVHTARGAIQAALISVSNLTPILPALDILNIPFWCAEQQQYLNLISSNTWQNHVLKKIHQQGKLTILMHYLPGARTVTSTKRYGEVIKTPQDMLDIVFRIPASKVLNQFYDLCGTRAVQVPWKKVATLAEGGRIEALDPSIVGLFNGPNNLRKHLGVISSINSVQDGWLFVVNQPWFNALPLKLKHALHDAASKTFTEHLAQQPNIARYCERSLKKLGTDIYVPNQEEIAQWHALAGPEQPQWLPFKRQLLGSEKGFMRFFEAAQA
ncbi:TRAP transporter substrate-binding protein DctP [Pseudoalteromonas sp. MMG022]|uniref:TRAP transporter substrate-binding protein n=1 Tax=Pseudoalteromonas sp. MMG022 TaxID=2909978 RepID=UPI001F002F90|nr:TRAP transporter substrate-binding protein DctP [Pseudoalteromonas sp. MMG022]MCF6435002.1 TRAP transporter substrate-binding protein DctP [Pseudoalteromonas sp. MMG022]